MSHAPKYPTFGPKHRYGAILFIEKEGFMPLLKAVRLAERYDLAVMSTKGMSVTASRELVDTLCGDHSIPPRWAPVVRRIVENMTSFLRVLNVWPMTEAEHAADDLDNLVHQDDRAEDGAKLALAQVPQIHALRR